MLLSALSATLLDFLFKWQVYNDIEPGEQQLGFFAWYYAAGGVLVFVVQLGVHRFALDRLGLARTVMAPAVAVVAGGLGAIGCPNLYGITIARGAESVLRGSLFRSAYEIFFTPLPAADKRAAKSLIDVGVDRVGEAAGAGLVALVIVAGLASRWQYRVILLLAIAASVGGMLVARRLTRGYVEALERSLREQAVALSLSDVRDRTTRAVWQTMMTSAGAAATTIAVPAGSHGARPSSSDVFDQDVLQILALRSRQIERVERVLTHDAVSPRRSSPHVIALLDSPALAGLAAPALTAAADEHAGAMTDALLDERRPSGIRRRIARVLAGNPTQRGVDGLLSAMSQRDFSVRVQCGQSLAQIHASHPELSVDTRVVLAAVLKELSQGRVVWESHRSVLDAAMGRRNRFWTSTSVSGRIKVWRTSSRCCRSCCRRNLCASRIAACTPTTAGCVARRSSISTACCRRTCAMALWPFIEDGRARPPVTASRDEVLARLVQAHPSILINLQAHTPASGPVRGRPD